MRIIAGWARGRRLRAPTGDQTRPTSDRVREAVFNILGAPAQDMWVLDLFAGSGALGLEAISRGATGAVFVERAPDAVRTLRHNIEALDLKESTVVHRDDALRVLRWPPEHSYQWIFVDPPYQSTLAAEVLAVLGDSEILASGGVVIVEHDRRQAPAQTYGCLIRTDHRRYGDTEISFYRRAAEE